MVVEVILYQIHKISIYLLDPNGKMMDKVIYNRLLLIVESDNGLLVHQYAFQRINSIIEVNLAKDAMNCRGYCDVPLSLSTMSNSLLYITLSITFPLGNR